jgi:3-oxoacyl-[acyl-carrier protein] reductase
MAQLDNRVAVVTGAARGIGEATALRLAKDGAKVAVLDLNLDGAQKVVDKITANGGEGMALACDVSNKDQVESAINSVVERFGKLDILVNNAGVTRDAMLFKMTDDEWDTVINTHLKGSFLCSRAAQKHMVSQNYGKIIMISSTSALGNRGQTNYSTAKAGLQGMTKTMAIELGKFGINVNAIAPGFIESEMTRGIAEKTGVSFEEVKQAAIAKNAIKRTGKPEDIANAIAFLVSDEASYITGQVLYVAGKPTV